MTVPGLPTPLPTGLPLSPSGGTLLGGPPPTFIGGTIQVSIGGVTVTLIHGTLNIQRAVGQRTTGSFSVIDEAGAWVFTQGQPVIILDKYGTTRFAGVVSSVKRARVAQSGGVRVHQVQVADWHYLADKRLAPVSYTNQTLGFIANDLITRFLAAEGVTAGQIDTGPTIVSLTSNYATCAAVFDELVNKAGGGWYWNIDDSKAFNIRQQTTAPVAPYTLDDTLIERDSDSLTHGNPQFRNVEYVLGGVSQTSPQTETRQGDGKLTAFTFKYALSGPPSALTVNGVAKTVGVKGVDSGKDWYYAVGDAVLAQDNGGTVLTSGDTLSMTYIGQFPSVFISTNAGAVATQAARETAGTGMVEAADFDATITTSAQGFQSAAGFLSKYAQDLDVFECLTPTAGFLEGQVVTVNVPDYDLNNEQMLIESVTITDVGPLGNELPDLYFDIKAVSGPINMSWVQFYRAIAGQAADVIGAITIGQSSTLEILAQFSAQLKLEASLTATVTACPICGPSTLCGPSLIVC